MSELIYIDQLRSALRKEKKVVVKGIGTFTIEDRPRKLFFVPKTGEFVRSKYEKQIKFTPDKKLKDEVCL